MRLQNKVAIVTGAGSGFGRGIAETFAREGARIVVGDINEATGRETVAQIQAAGGQAHFVAVDVASAASMDRLREQALAHYSALHIVVNNAGATHRNRPMLEITEAEFDRIYAINVKSIFLSAQSFVPHFRRQGGGVFVNIASTAAIRPRPGLTWYNGTKGAVVTTSKSMAAELGPDRIRVNCVNPVIGATGLLTEFMGQPDTPENRAKFVAGIPLGRFSTPDDVANACLYLASDEAAFITGVCLEVDGGRCL
ncbi:MAG: SDR family oxidoreductase [Castellaniella sp.]|uniref:SDR family oxidoreductase n=1 Tax=Castellaniella sp. TaxID=1955812 RepID=UPI001223E298|nr:SDR family oxidoreductase [Castellaniella sp.]TAN27123.1 MAG: SDR family oxidoreductase [Castellaniella sp.]